MVKPPANIPQIRQWKLWFALLGGAVGWTAHLLLSYLIAEFGCVAGWGDRQFIGLSFVAWLLLVATVIALGFAITALLISRQIGRATGSFEDDPAPRKMPAFMAHLGLIINAIFIFIIVVQSIPILFHLRDC